MVYFNENTTSAHDTHNTTMPFSRIMNDLENEVKTDLRRDTDYQSDNLHKLATIQFLRDIYLYGAGKDKNALSIEEWDKAGLKQVEKTLKTIAKHQTLSPEEEEIFKNSFPNGVRGSDVYSTIKEGNHQRTKVAFFGTIGTAASVGVAAGLPTTFLAAYSLMLSVPDGVILLSNNNQRQQYDKAKESFSQLADDLTRVITTEGLRSNRHASPVR